MKPPRERVRDIAIFTGAIEACYHKASMGGREILLNANAHYVYSSYAETHGIRFNPERPRPWPSKVPE